MGAESSKGTRTFMVSDYTSQILFLNIRMCYFFGMKDEGKRTLFLMIISQLH